MEEIFEIRSCIEILANDIKVDTTYHKMNHMKQLTIIILQYNKLCLIMPMLKTSTDKNLYD